MAAALAAAVLLCGGLVANSALQEDKSRLSLGEGAFERTVLGETLHLFAIGLADIDGDGLLDPYTNNHFLAESYFRNLGGSFRQDRLALGLSSNPDFPGAEISSEAPVMDTPGLYVFWQEGVFQIIARGQPSDAPRHISLDLIGGVLVQTEGDVEVLQMQETSGGQIGGDALPTRMTIAVAGDGTVTMRSLQWAVNGTMDLDPAFDLSSVFVGQGRVSPASHRIVLMPGGDRHGGAWVDLDADGHVDVVTVSGGEVGRMSEPEPYPVFFGGEERFSGPQALPGLKQELCPSRQILLGDADGDGWDDLYIVCGRGSPPRADHPNELFIRTGQTSFENRAARMGLDLPGLGKARWFDAEGDGVPELLWATARDISVFARHGGVFEAVFTAPRAGAKAQVAMGDADGAGGPDFFVASPDGTSAVLLTGPAGYRLAEPEEFGLPRRAECAAFLDVDNDGDDDFHALPGGLFERADGEDRPFRPTSLLASGDYPAFCLWFDADNDGAQDLFAALPATDPPATRIWRKLRTTWEGLRYRGRYTGRVYDPLRWNLSLYHAVPGLNHWLEVDLAGPPGNPSGAGARIEVSAGGRELVRQAGQAEGSTSSNGQFRSYFGLGQADTIAALTVFWSDGTVQRLDPAPPADRLVRIAHPGAR
jgi:hypothetical protein